jgi:hypothetical protein
LCDRGAVTLTRRGVDLKVLAAHGEPVSRLAEVFRRLPRVACPSPSLKRTQTHTQLAVTHFNTLLYFICFEYPSKRQRVGFIVWRHPVRISTGTSTILTEVIFHVFRESLRTNDELAITS